jgi:hypothetical protein
VGVVLSRWLASGIALVEVAAMPAGIRNLAVETVAVVALLLLKLPADLVVAAC